MTGGWVLLPGGASWSLYPHLRSLKQQWSLISILPSVSLKLTYEWVCEEGSIVHKPTTQLLWDLYASPMGRALYPVSQLFLVVNANSRFYPLKPPMFLH